MKRRDFLKKAGMGTAAVVASTAVNAPAVLAKKSYRWKMVTTWPPKLPVLQEGCERLAKRIGEVSDGRLQIQVFAAGELVPALGIFDAVSQGTVEVGSGASYYWAGKAPAAQWFAAVPFGMNAQGLAAWFHGGGGLELWEEVYAPFNLIPRPGGSTGVQMGGWFNKKINSIKDFKGLKMRIPGLGGKVLSKAGGTVVLLPGGEILHPWIAVSSMPRNGSVRYMTCGWGSIRPPNTTTTPVGMNPEPIWSIFSIKRLMNLFPRTCSILSMLPAWKMNSGCCLSSMPETGLPFRN
jgi:TRAP-type mannitol/chloroaromatic compound transport system substrate-binding protein